MGKTSFDDALFDVYVTLARQIGVFHILFALEIALDIRSTTGSRLPRTGWRAALSYLINWRNSRLLYASMYANTCAEMLERRN